MSQGNGHDPATAQMVEILHKIHVELVGVRAAVNDLSVRLDATNARLDATNARLDAFREEVREDLGALRADVTGIRNELGSLRVELRVDLDELRGSYEGRLARLEAAVFKKAS